MREVNALAEMLRGQRLGALEATALLRKVMAEIDVAVFAFDEQRRAAAGQPRRRAPARQRRPSACSAARRGARPRSTGSTGDAPRIEPIVASPAAPAAGKCAAAPSASAACRTSWSCSTDLSSRCARRSAQAWQRLIRVLGHELNNSLAPIKSIAGSLEQPGRSASRARPTGRTTCGAASA